MPETKTKIPSNMDIHDASVALSRYQAVRQQTERLAKPLSPEDTVIQTMADVSPTKWHLAHTSWFFETFILKCFANNYDVFDERFHYLFNSYYEAEGPRHARPERGFISRPDLEEVIAYRAYVDKAMENLLKENTLPSKVLSLLHLGCHHEEQHQELLLTDIKHVLGQNPFPSAYSTVSQPKPLSKAPPLSWTSFEEGVFDIGHDGSGFGFDCEGPRHKQYVHAFKLANRLITNSEYLAFIEDGGYTRPELWLSDGWDRVRQDGWQAPLYWRKGKDGWQEFTLYGQQPLNPSEPVVHVSYYEADAFATWAGKRLPREKEMELALFQYGPPQKKGALHPLPVSTNDLCQLNDTAWQWTMSAYSPYPGFKAAQGAVGEYNGKFMCNQMVLRGGSLLTPEGHTRPTYRNFFHPHARWQMTGIRLASDGE